MCLKNYAWRSVILYRRKQNHHKEKEKSKKAKWLSEEAEERREVKSKGERERYTQLNAEFQRIARRARRPSAMNSAKK